VGCASITGATSAVNPTRAGHR